MSPNAFDCNDIGENEVTLTVEDTNENTSTCTVTVLVEDNLPPQPVCHNPVISFNGEDEIDLLVEEIWNSEGSSDNCEEVFFSSLSASSVTCGQVGSIVPITVTTEDANGNMASCSAQVTVSGLPCGWNIQPNSVGCADAEAGYDPITGDFELTSEGCYTPGYYRQTDAHGFIQHEWCGDVELIAQVSNIQGNAWAGISLRESNAPGAKMLQLLVNNNGLAQRELRTATGAFAFITTFLNNGQYWLRLTRVGNTLSAYMSLDGVQWNIVMAIQLPMQNCIQVGLITTNSIPTGEATATFSNVSLIGNGSGLIAPNTNQEVGTILQPEVRLFPNPARSQITVDFSTPREEPVQLRLYNQVGQLLEQRQLPPGQTQLQWDIKSYNSGLYFLEIPTTGSQTKVLRFLKSE